MKIRIKQNLSLLIVFLVVLFGHLFVGMYYDDYGYASLSYAYLMEGVEKTNYGLFDILYYLFQHYLVWGGRVLYFLFEIICLKIDVKVFMLVQSVFITGIFYLTYKIASLYKANINKNFALFFVLGLYMFFPSEAFSMGIYWASASVAYVWPLFFAFWGIYKFILLSRQNTQKLSLKDKISLPILFLLATFSQEQVGLLVVVFLLAYILIFEYKKYRQYLALNALALLPSFVGYALLMLAPGNFARNTDTAGELPFLERTGYNILIVFKQLFTGESFVYSVLICLALLIFFFVRRGKVQREDAGILALLLGAGASQAMMVLLPTTPLRTMLPFYFPLFILLLIALSYLPKTKLSYIGFSVFLCLALANYAVMSYGYIQNYAVLRHNHQVLQKVQEQPYSEIHLLKVPREEYVAMMPYFESGEPTYHWMREYYGISNDDMQFIWHEEEPDEDIVQAVHFHTGLEYDGWVAPELTLDAQAKEEGVLTIAGTYPGEITQALVIEARVNGQDAQVFELTENQFTIEIELPPSESSNVVIESDFLYTGNTLDERDLSFHLDGIVTS